MIENTATTHQVAVFVVSRPFSEDETHSVYLRKYQYTLSRLVASGCPHQACRSSLKLCDEEALRYYFSLSQIILPKDPMMYLLWCETPRLDLEEALTSAELVIETGLEISSEKTESHKSVIGQNLEIHLTARVDLQYLMQLWGGTPKWDSNSASHD